MGVWGRGLMQSDDDYDIASDLSEMCECQLVFMGEEEVEEREEEYSVKRLNDGVLSQKLDKILSADFQPRTSHHKRERVAIILAMLAMELGIKIEDRHMVALQVLRPWLPTIEQQLQLLTALDEYKNNGTPWKSGSKNLAQTMHARECGKGEYDLGDEFWFSGLGHSTDEGPTSDMFDTVTRLANDTTGESTRKFVKFVLTLAFVLSLTWTICTNCRSVTGVLLQPINQYLNRVGGYDLNNQL
ncbi:hypothetical protein F4804DRAFT_329275 [Jackrogersella minutella]|nr:hypothetical protein F4804DRAFT_329275 [Jackrogersella minutella]